MKNNKNKLAFTFIEMSITIFIIGIVLITTISFQFSLVEISHKKITNDRLKQIQKAINNYVLKNGYLPCPSNINLSVKDVNFGKELRNSIGCTMEGTDDIIYGGIPTVSLELSNDFAIDGWKSNIIYVLNKNSAKNIDGFLNENSNKIVIKSLQNEEIKEKILFLIFSTGKNKNGSIRQAFFNKTNDTDNSLNDYENIDFDNVFIKDIDEDFDDILVYENKDDILLKLNLENISCHLDDLKDVGEQWQYSTHPNCPNKLCPINIEIQQNIACQEGYFSKNITNRPARKCLKYGKWSEEMYSCLKGCNFETIYLISDGNFYTNNTLFIDEGAIRKTEPEETKIFQCINGKIGFVKLKCSKLDEENTTWEYISGECYDI